MPAPSTDPNALLEASKCLACIPDGAHLRVQSYLLALIAGVSPDPDALLAASKCFACLDGQHAQVQSYLLDVISNK